MTGPLLAGRTIRGPASARIEIDGRPYVNFFGSGYLALSREPSIEAAVSREMKHAVWTRTLPAVMGAGETAFDAAEAAIARYMDRETGLFLPSGYLIGMAALSAVDAFTAIFIDAKAHYSLQDAAKLSGRPVHVFAHCDPEALRDALELNLRPRDRPLLLTDGIFATWGRAAPLDVYAAVLAQFDGLMVVDESHAFGVVGSQGRGVAELCGVEQLAIVGASLGKAFCAQGAALGGTPARLRRAMSSPPVAGASAGSPLSAAAASAALNFMSAHPERRQHLQELTQSLRRKLGSAGLELADTPAPIVTFRLGRRDDMLRLQARLFARGIYVYHSNYIGAGPEGVLRCSVFADHTDADFDALVHELT